MAENLARLGATRSREDAAELTALISGLVIDQLSLPRTDFLERVLMPGVRRRVRLSLADAPSGG